jgi:hypothetical protein
MTRNGPRPEFSPDAKIDARRSDADMSLYQTSEIYRDRVEFPRNQLIRKLPSELRSSHPSDHQRRWFCGGPGFLVKERERRSDVNLVTALYRVSQFSASQHL